MCFLNNLWYNFNDVNRRENIMMKNRNLNIDLVKCVAVFSVISVHFLQMQDYTGML